ncbi:MAG: adenylate/guanylate cyclase domain-containing protein [Armatimonadetes bacterium]|nr:adenylate/guanylate cyclase domain-containing protein [Armatimonadota bacterium]
MHRYRDGLPTFTTGPRAWLHGFLTASLIGILFVAASHSGRLDSLNLSWLDALLFVRGAATPTEAIRIVGATDEDFKLLGYPSPPTQMPRQQLAQAIRRIAEAQARVLVLDVLLDTPDGGQGQRQEEELVAALAAARRLGLRMTAAASLQGSDGEMTLAQPAPKFGLQEDIGLADVVLWPDGVVRSFCLLTEADGKPLPALAARAVTLYDPTRHETIWRHSREVMIDYRGPAGTFPALPFSALVKDQIPPEWLRDRIVLLGRLDYVARDQHRVPPIAGVGAETGHGLMSGVEVQANAVATLLSRSALKRTSFVGDVLLQLLIAAIASYVAMRRGTMGVLAFLLAGLVVAIPLSLLLLASANYWVNVVPSGLALAGYAVVTEASDRRRLQALFGPYVGPTMLKQLWRQRRALELGGQERLVTLLVFDIRDSTTAAERIEPTKVGALLNELFSAVAPAIWGHGGAVNKYLGDGLLATFNAPMDQSGHAQAGVLAAMEAVRTASRLAPRWRAETGYDLVAYAAVHTGRVLAGNIGSPNRMEYTVVGDNVNIAFRMMNSCKEHDALIQVSESTRQACPRALPGARFEVELRGRPGRFVLYALQGFQMSRFLELAGSETE